MTPRSIFYLFLILISHSAFCQLGNNSNILPVGDKEPMMANTGTGGLGSTGAVFYNPAALTMIEGTSVSLSGDAYMSYKFSARPLITILGTNINYEGKGFQSIPTSVITAKQVGTWRFAFSALVPTAMSFEGMINWDIPASGETIKLSLTQNYSESILMSGLTAAKDLGSGWSVGISAYAQFYKYLFTLDLKNTFTADPDYIYISQNREKINPTNLLIITGLQHRWEKWNLGLKVTLPNMYIFGKSEYYSFTYSNTSSTSSTKEEISITDAKTRYKTPWEIRLGTTFIPDKKFNMALDVSYSTGLNYNMFDTPEYVQERNVYGYFRMSLGTEFIPSDKFHTFTGFSYTPIQVEDGNDKKTLAYYSYFAGIRNNAKRANTSIGFFYTFGNVEREILEGNGQTKEHYRYIGIFLGTNYDF